MQLLQHVCALAGRGLQGDRYAEGAGTFSPRGAPRQEPLLKLQQLDPALAAAVDAVDAPLPG